MSISASTVGARSTSPGILVQLGDLRYSSRGNLSWGGYDWSAADITAAGPVETGEGRAELAIVLADNATTWPALVLAGLPADMTCACWRYYLTDAGAAETELQFSGVVRAVRISEDGQGQSIGISGITEGPDVTWSPRIAWHSPYAVRRGGEVRINDETFILE